MAKIERDTGGGCSVCGGLPAVNVSGTYWLCGPCAHDDLAVASEKLAAMREAEDGARLRTSQLIAAGEEYADATQALEIEMRNRRGLVYGQMPSWPRYDTARDKWNGLVLERKTKEAR